MFNLDVELPQSPRTDAKPKSQVISYKQKIQEKRNEVQSLRDALPILTKAEIRRFRIPYHEALLAELQENGFANSQEFLAQLFKYQEDYRKEHSYDVIILSRPVLIQNNDELNRMFVGLKKAEQAHFNNEIGSEIDELLRLAHHYASGPIDWWWLAEQFFAQCITISENYHDDDKYRQMMTYYFYGKYLIEQTKQIPLGMEFLNIAREYSRDREWTGGKISGKVEKYIFVEVCTVLYNTLMDQVNAILKYDAELALELCLEARQRGIDACLPRADVFFLQGKCEMEIGQSEKAVGSFMKAFLLYKTSNQTEKCCEAMICLAQAFQLLGKWSQTKDQLQKLLAFAEKEGLKQYVGQAYLYIGQYFLNAGTPELASPYLTRALDIFHEINDVPHREFVKNLGAISRGQETFASFVKLILRCEDWRDVIKRRRNIVRLLNWKDSREPFWDEMTESYSSVSMMPEWDEEEEEGMSYEQVTISQFEKAESKESIPEIEVNLVESLDVGNVVNISNDAIKEDQ